MSRISLNVEFGSVSGKDPEVDALVEKLRADVVAKEARRKYWASFGGGKGPGEGGLNSSFSSISGDTSSSFSKASKKMFFLLSDFFIF